MIDIVILAPTARVVFLRLADSFRLFCIERWLRHSYRETRRLFVMQWDLENLIEVESRYQAKLEALAEDLRRSAA